MKYSLSVCLDEKSNCRNDKQFVVQAWSNVDNWQDTVEADDTEEGAIEKARKLFNNKNFWMNNSPTAVRVVSSLGKRYSVDIE